MVQTLRSYATMGVAVVGAGMIAVTPLAIPDVHQAAPHSTVEVALTSSAGSAAFGFADFMPGEMDPVAMMTMMAPLLGRLTDNIVDIFDRLNESSVDIDSHLVGAGLTGMGAWIGAEYGLVQSALVGDDFDPSTFDSSTLLGPELTFALELSWASGLLGLSGDHSAELNELFGLSSQLLTGALNTLVVSLGTINPLLSDFGSETDMTEVHAAVQSLFTEYSTQADGIVSEMMPILQDLNLLGILDFGFSL